MTSTPSADPNQQRFNVLRKAGTLFGLDLSGLFEDDEGEGGGTGFGGLVPSFQVTNYLKGRSPSTLTYKTPKTPAREATFSLTAPSEAVQAPTAPAPSGGGTSYTPPPTPIPQQKNYNVDISRGLSSSLFGHEDYYKNLEAGVPQQFLQDWVSQNVGLLSEGNRPGQGGLYDQMMSGRVARTSGLNAPAGSSAPVDLGSGLSAEKFGHADYFANLAAGKTPEQLRQYVQQNVGQLAGGNVPGGGGLYDQIMSGSVNVSQVNPTPSAPAPAPAAAPAPAPAPRLNAAIAAAGNRVSNQEARQIARQTGKSVQQVKNRAERQGKR